MLLLTTPIGEIAAAQPSSTRVFLRHRLDFCCGGQRTLEDACVAADLNPVEVAAEIERAAASSHDRALSWEHRSQHELADHIERHYHTGVRRDLPPLIEAARKVERVHAGKPAVPAGLAEVLAAFFGEMEQHMAKEEQILFPMLRRGERGPQVAMPIRVMEHEHDAHGAQLARIRELTHDLQPPPHACATWNALYHGLAAVEADLMEHIHLENHVLFARATAGVA